MGDHKATLVFTDPPYKFTASGGCKLGPNGLGKTMGSVSSMACFDPSVLLALLPGYFQLRSIAAMIFTSKDLLPDYLGWAKQVSTEKRGKLVKMTSNLLFWDKCRQPVPIGSAHWADVEYLVYFRKNGTWNDGIKGLNRKRHLQYPLVKGEHPCAKPIDLIANQIRLTTKANDIVVDPFAGSGSTLFACHKTGRVCYLSEYDLSWCDRIAERYYELTGCKPVAIGGLDGMD